MYESDMFTSTDQVYNEKTALNDFKRNNVASMFHTVTRRFNNEWKGKFYNNIKISYYGTNTTSGSRIRHAITGEVTQFIVGRKKDESNFFKVVVGSGQHSNGPVHLFYNSPEEYENHQFVVLEQDIKERWFNNITN
jgi:hypothetical protein